MQKSIFAKGQIKRKGGKSMPKKKKRQEEIDDDAREIIIGLNSKKNPANPPRKNKKSKKKVVNKSKSKQISQEPKKTKKKKKKSKLKKVLKVLLKLAVVIAIAVAIIAFLFVSPIFDIKEITVEGANAISESVYIAMSGIDIGQNIFGIEKTNAIIRIKEEPYVESVDIKSIYPNKIEISIVERTISYALESSGKYYLIDKHGYILETSLSEPEYILLKGHQTNLETLQLGERLNEKDLSKFNDLIKIIDAIENNTVGAELKSINITDTNNYILEFKEENKIIMLGDTKDLSAKMTWINFFVTQNKNQGGTIYLNSDNVYFAPDNGGN